MTVTDRFLPGTRRVLVVAPPGASALSVVGPIETFDVANRFLAARGRPPLYEVGLAALRPEVHTSAGVPLLAEPLERAEAPHTLLIGGGPQLPEAEVDPALLQEVGRLAASSARIVSVCGGAFVLGSLGLLNGRRCTTHWLWLDELRRRFPEALVEPDAIYTQDGPVWTSAGVTAGIDLALQLVKMDGGARLAAAVARGLVMFVHRPGGQAQFGAATRLRSGLDDRLRALVARITADPAAQLDVPCLAASVGMSPRNFARVFLAQTGATPADFVARARVEAAQRALAGSDAGLAQIAQDCGFGTEATLRRTFHRVLGVSPSDWRERFSAGPA